LDKKIESIFLKWFTESSNVYEYNLPSKTGRINAIPTWPILPKPYIKDNCKAECAAAAAQDYSAFITDDMTVEQIAAVKARVNDGCPCAHKVGTEKGDLVLTGGFGMPSAGMLKISEGTKSFGVLGQERVIPPENGTTYDKFAGATRGISYPDPPSDCSNGSRAYTQLTIIPKKKVEGKKLKFEMKAIPFAGKDVVNLNIPDIK
jgi:hypothetical protein